MLRTCRHWGAGNQDPNRDPALCIDVAGDCAADIIMDGANPALYTYAWLLRQVEDVSGNTIDIEYTTREENDAVEVLPAVIYYTGHITEGKGDRRIEFSYEDRPDKHHSFMSGFGMGAFRRLSRVETFAPGTPGAIRSYNLSYARSGDTARFLLDELRECSFGGACREPVTFEYASRGGFSLSYEETPAATGPWTVLDSDGNGQHELIVSDTLYRWENVWLGFPYNGSTAVVDYDFDGVDEVVSGGEYKTLQFVVAGGPARYELVDGPPSAGTSYCHRDDDGSAGRYTGRFDPTNSGIESVVHCARHPGEGFLVSDFDGDGVDERRVVVFDNPESAVLLPGAPAPAHVAFDLNSTWYDESLNTFHMTRVYGDMNGDGLSDALGLWNPLEPEVWINTGDGFLPPTPMPVDVSQCQGPTAPCDNLADILDAWVNIDDISHERRRWRFRHRLEDIRQADFDNDGRTDLLIMLAIDSGVPYFEGETADNDRVGLPWVFLNRTDHFVPYFAGHPLSITTPTALYPMVVEGSDAGQFTHALMDADGDGNMDVILHGALLRSSTGTSDRLLGARTGGVSLGSFEYEQLPAVHQPGEECSADARCARYGVVVGTETTGTGEVFDHEYAGLRYDQARNESLGFDAHRVTERDGGAFVERHYDTSYQDGGGRHSHLGTPSLEMQVQGSAADRYEVQYRETSFGETVLAPDEEWPTRVPEVDGITERAYEVDGWQCDFPCDPKIFETFDSDWLLRAADKTLIHDIFGSVESFQESVPGEFVNVTTFTLENRITDPETQFILGLAAQVLRSSTAHTADGLSESALANTHSFDTAGRTWRTGHAHVGGSSNIETAESVTELELNAYGQPTSMVHRTNDNSAPARGMQFFYDEDSTHLRRVVNAAGHVVDAVIHPATGATVFVRDGNGRERTRTTDGFGRHVRSESGTGWAETSYVDDVYLQIQQRTSGAPEQRTDLDVFGRVRHRRVEHFGTWADTEVQWLADGRVDRVIESDIENNPVSTERPVTRYYYDSRDRTTRVTRNVGTDIREIERVNYAGRSTWWVDHDEGGTTSQGTSRYVSTDLAGRVADSFDWSTSAETHKLNYDYGPFQRLISTTDELGHAWTQNYDAQGRLEQSSDPDSGVRHYNYDGFGQLTTESWNRGLGTEPYRETFYDVMGRPKLVHERDVPGQSMHSTVIGWDPLGNLGALDYAYREVDNVSHEFAYDDEGRPVNTRLKVDGETFEFGYGYNAEGQLARIDYPKTPAFAGRPEARLRVENVYAGGRLSEVRDADQGGMFWRADQYATTGGVLDETFGNGVSTTRRVDALVGRPEQIRTEGTGGVLSDLTLHWNDDGRLRARSEDTESGTIDEEFDYDPLGRLESWDTNGRRTGDFSYDTRGNLTSLQYAAFNSSGHMTDNWGHSLTYQGRAHVFSVDGAKATHDAHGRWTRLEDNGSGNGWQATFNLFDLPTTMHRGGDTTRYRYDAFGNRVWMERDKRTLVTFGSLFEKERDGEQESYVMRIMGASGPVAELNEESSVVETVYVHHDHLGNRTMTTTENGKVLEQHRYTPFGELLGMDGAPLGSAGAPSLQSGFGGHRHEDTGFVDMRGRHYDPEIGRFLTVDPVNIAPLNSLSYNGYAYVWNDPLSLTDPTGFSPDYSDEGTAVGAGIVGLIGLIADLFGNSGGGGGGGGGHGPEGYGLVMGDQSAPPPRRRAVITDVQRTRVRRAPVPREGMQLNTVQTRVAPDWDLQLANALSESTIVNLFIGIGDGVSGGLSADFRESVGVTYDTDGEGYGVGHLAGWGILTFLTAGMAAEVAFARVAATEGLIPLTRAFIAEFTGTGFLTGAGGMRLAGAWASIRNFFRRGPQCFVAGTLVATAVGLVAIEDIEVGDLVLSMDEETGEVVEAPVLETFVTPEQEIVEVALVGDDGASNAVRTTSGHPFWTGDDWTPAGELTVGDIVYQLGGAWLHVASMVWTGEYETVYNFEVGGSHTYFVGESEAWVHNTGPCHLRDGVRFMDPTSISGSHPVRLSSRFADDALGTVSDLRDALIRDPTLAQRIPPIEVLRIRGTLYSANNRRLRAFQAAFSEAGLQVPTVPAGPAAARAIRRRLGR